MRKILASREDTFTATYLLSSAGEVRRNDLVLTPMQVHARLASHYRKRVVAGQTHDEAMTEVQRASGAVVV